MQCLRNVQLPLRNMVNLLNLAFTSDVNMTNSMDVLVIRWLQVDIAILVIRWVLPLQVDITELAVYMGQRAGKV